MSVTYLALGAAAVLHAGAVVSLGVGGLTRWVGERRTDRLAR